MAPDPRTRPFTSSQESPTRVRAAIRGAVQGVGFRPFIYRLAMEMGLTGWVNNAPQGVFLEVEGPEEAIGCFLQRMREERPPRAMIRGVETETLEPAGYPTFSIRASDTGGARSALVLPDIATCPDCARELFDPQDRRYRYPFTNCTNCGPRFSIISALPYDRPNTTMAGFAMCDRCRAEYEDPANRRFHAQPNACPDCGPHIELWNPKGRVIGTHEAALEGATRAVRRGHIVAVKGLGGFHLITDACDNTAVRRLRRRKQREEKPFALMVPSLAGIRAECDVSPAEEALLLSPEAPIVLLRRYDVNGSVIADSIAPRNPYLGVMLPYTPLHHLLMADLGFPVVATSGNRSDEPICTDEREGLERLSGIADYFLVHNRPILRHVDDSVVRVIHGRPMLLRRARGFAPMPVHLEGCDEESPRHLLAVGAHLKNCIAASVGAEAFVSQHIGDLETSQASAAFERVVADFHTLYELEPEAVACDAHPDYLSTQYALRSDVPAVPVQHHYAHALSCMADNGLCAPALGVSWDGTGYGLDGTIWGGEFLRVLDDGFERFAHLRPFPLPGGDKAVKEPRRSAFGLLYAMLGEAILEREDLHPVRAFVVGERSVLASMLRKDLNAPRTTSMGRLFDAVASLTGLRQEDCFEGQAAMELEWAMDTTDTSARYEFALIEPDAPGAPIVVDWEPVIRALLRDVKGNVPVSRTAARFHEALVDLIVAVARRAGEEHVVLSGGCFQNTYLLERAIRRLENEGFVPFWHHSVPPNDGGIAVGQIVAAARHRAIAPAGGCDERAA